MITIYNSSTAAIAVTDIPVPQTIAPNESAAFSVRDVLTSRVLSENLVSQGANGPALCITNFGSWGAGGPFMPVTYLLHALGTETNSGESAPVTVGPFQAGSLLLNVTAISSGSSLTVNWQEFDGTTYYPVGTIIPEITTNGPQVYPFSEYGISGNVVWTITGSVTFSLLLQMRN